VFLFQKEEFKTTADSALVSDGAKKNGTIMWMVP